MALDGGEGVSLAFQEIMAEVKPILTFTDDASRKAESGVDEHPTVNALSYKCLFCLSMIDRRKTKNSTL